MPRNVPVMGGVQPATSRRERLAAPKAVAAALAAAQLGTTSSGDGSPGLAAAPALTVLATRVRTLELMMRSFARRVPHQVAASMLPIPWYPCSEKPGTLSSAECLISQIELRSFQPQR